MRINALIAAGRPRPHRRAQPGRSRAPRRPAAGVRRPLPPRLAHPGSPAPPPSTPSPATSPATCARRSSSRRPSPTACRCSTSRSTRATARQIVVFGANDLNDDADVNARPVTRSKSKTSAFVSDFRDLAVGDYVVHVEHGIARYCGLRVHRRERPARRSS